MPYLSSFNRIEEIYQRPLIPLLFEASRIHSQHHSPGEIQISSLISIKTGGCPEDCSYCPQSAHYKTDLVSTPLLSTNEVEELAKKAISTGASRICLGAAWSKIRDNEDFEQVLESVRKITALGVEVCCTLGMLTLRQAERLKEAGLDYYNHNIDTSSNHYEKIITTRNHPQRLETLKNVGAAHLKICSGGILGMGESQKDRMAMIATLADLEIAPHSIPINLLVPIPGTPLQDSPPVNLLELIRCIATCRITFPLSAVRLSAGRENLSTQDQLLCFLAGANSIFSGDKLLTTPNPSPSKDAIMMETLGLYMAKPPKKDSADQSSCC